MLVDASCSETGREGASGESRKGAEGARRTGSRAARTSVSARTAQGTRQRRQRPPPRRAQHASDPQGAQHGNARPFSLKLSGKRTEQSASSAACGEVAPVAFSHNAPFPLRYAPRTSLGLACVLRAFATAPAHAPSTQGPFANGRACAPTATCAKERTWKGFSQHSTTC